MSTTSGNMKTFKVTDQHGNQYIMIPVDTEARQAIDEAKNLQFDENHFKAEESQDGKDVNISLNEIGLEVDTTTPLQAQVTNDAVKLGVDSVFSDSVATSFITGVNYTKGAIVTYKSKIYKSRVAQTNVSSFDASKWEQIMILPQKNYDAEAVLEVVEAVEKMQSDLDTKLNTTLLLGNVMDYYETPGGAKLLAQAFTVPINTNIRTITEDPNLPTLISIISLQDYQSTVILGLYEYSFATSEDTEKLTYLCDTGLVTIHQGKNEFPIRNINNLIDHELKSDKIYYATIYEDYHNGLKLLGAPGCNTSQDIRPRLNIYKSLSTGLTTLSGVTLSPGDTQDSNSFPRILMMIRNGYWTESPLPPVNPFTELSNISFYVPGESGAKTYAGLMNGQTPSGGTPYNVGYFGWQQITPAANVDIIGWEVLSPSQSQEDDTWNEVPRLIYAENDPTNPIIDTSQTTLDTVTQTSSWPLYIYKTTINNSGYYTLEANKSYWFPICGTWSSDGSAKPPIYSTTSPQVVARNIMISTKKWLPVESQYCVIIQNQAACYLKLYFRDGTSAII